MDEKQDEKISESDIEFPCPTKGYVLTNLGKCKECWYRSTCDEYITMANEDF